MRHSIVFSSRTGNTEELAGSIREEIAPEDLCWYGKPDGRALEADRIFVGFWTNKGSADDDTAEFLKGLRNKEIFLFGTAGFGGSDAYYRTILKRTEELLDPSVKVIGSFMCQGRMPITVRERYEKMKAMPDAMPNIDRLIENFDSAVSHPDRDDLKNVREAAAPFTK